MKMKLSVVVVCSGMSFAGCAGSVRGDIDGESIPTFYDAALGGVEVDEPEGFLLVGYNLPGDSCEDGAALIASTGDDDEDRVDTINELVPVGDWQTQLLLGGTSFNDLKNETYDLSDGDNEVGIQLSFCRQKREADVDDDGIDFGNDCYRAADGDLTLELSDDDEQLRIVSDGELEVVDDDGDDVGDVTVDITFKGCQPLIDEVKDLVEA